MKSKYIAVASLALLSPLASSQVVINELDSDVDSSVSLTEFIELYDGGTGNTSLDGMVLVLYNGSGDVSYAAFDLTGQTTDGNGFFVIGDANVANLDLDWGSQSLQNGVDAVALYNDVLASFPNGTAATETNLIDAVVYNAGGGTDEALSAILTPGFGTVNEDANSNENFDSIARKPDGGTARDTSTYLAGAPTPGATNGVASSLSLSLGASTIVESEDGTTPILATVTRSDTSGGDLDVTITISDETEASAVATVTIVGTDPSAQFSIYAEDDLFPDGTQVVEVSVAAAGVIGASETFDVTDDVTDTYSLVINELHIVPDASTGDVNGDLTVNNDDEFIEIVNVTGATIDLTGFSVRDRFNTTHDFRDGTLLDPGCALLVFSGEGALAVGTTAAFGNAEVQVASAGQTLRLTNSGDDVAILNDAGLEVYAMTYGDMSGLEANGSLALQVDKDATSGYAQHGLIAGAAGALSPGFFLDGTTPFCTVTQELTVVLTPGSVAEDAGAGAALARVSIPSSLGYNLEVAITGSDPSEAVPGSPSTGTITAGATFVDIPVDAVDDALVDGTQTVTITGIASGFLNGAGDLDVTDAGDSPTFTDLVINEVDANQPSSDTAEFVELFNLTSSVQSLNGLVLVLINGNGDVVYDVIDLSGYSIPADGFFVLGNAGVPNLDVTLGSNALQNGTDAVAIYAGSVSDYDGKGIDSFPAGAPIDVVIYDDNGTADPELEAFFGVSTLSDEGDGGEDDSLSRAADGTGAFVAQAPTPGATNEVTTEPEGLKITAVQFAGTTVAINVVGLGAGETYSMDETSDLGQTDPWTSLGTFQIGDGNVNPTGNPDEYQVFYTDPDIGTAPTKQYRIQAQ